MKTDYINDSQVFQLDIANNGTKIKINDPAVNPYDFKEKTISDTVNFSKRK
ncbi:hypothetical protein [Mucilaginibacter ginsenosidivorax]|uniref:hypothetical protein n=1 Tax=Mucilaginibacter ginsenosidivorax TaxID=862126 RepID=UPI00131509AC|nr:hypothetical protein [Mucilaginibacter ginsenosidivorax]